MFQKDETFRLKVFFISAILRIRYQTVETVSSQSDGFGGIMLKRKNKYISWLLVSLMCFSHSFTVINGEEEVQAEESETYEVTEEEQAEEAKIVKSKKFQLAPMSVDEAVMQMELLQHNFFIYLDQETDSVSVVYKRNDGHYGVVEAAY